VLICSAVSPVYPGMESGVTLGLVELYDVKPIKEFTPRIGKHPDSKGKEGENNKGVRVVDAQPPPGY